MLIKIKKNRPSAKGIASSSVLATEPSGPAKEQPSFTAGGPSPSKKPKLTRAAVIDVALTLAESQGAELSFHEVAKALGVSRPALYVYFQDADTLRAACAIAMIERCLPPMAFKQSGEDHLAKLIADIGLQCAAKPMLGGVAAATFGANPLRSEALAGRLALILSDVGIPVQQRATALNYLIISMAGIMAAGGSLAMFKSGLPDMNGVYHGAFSAERQALAQLLEASAEFCEQEEQSSASSPPKIPDGIVATIISGLMTFQSK